MVETTRFAIFRSQAGRETPSFRLRREDGSWPPDSSGLLQCGKDWQAAVSNIKCDQPGPPSAIT